MGNWNYRVCRKNSGLAIYSVSYDNEGKIISYSQTPVLVVSEYLEEIETELKLKKEALKKEIIDLS